MQLFGVLNLDKPAGCTSHDVVVQVRKKLGIKKVGHCGTLDPLATGVLPVCVGPTTRLIEYFPGDKRYRAEITFGIRTVSWDAEGEIVATQSAKALTPEILARLLPQFVGVIQQQVPPHAAVHVQGKKLYEYARKGIAVELPVRPAEVFAIDMVDFDRSNPDHPVVTLDVHCASGTYIRSIAQALGMETGYGAYLSALVRTAHGKFTLEDSIALQAFMESPHPHQYLQNPVPFLPMPRFDLTEDNLVKICHGMKLNPLDLPERVRNNRLYLLLHQNIPVAVAAGEETGRLKPLKVFCADMAE